MGGAQPLAVTLNGGVAICVEVDPSRIDRRIAHRYLDVRAESVDDALRLAGEARQARRPLSIGLLGNAADVVPDLLARGAEIDVVTDQTSAHDPLAYLPHGIDFDDWDDERRKDPAGFTLRARESMARHCEAMVGFADAGRRGVRLRQLAARRGPCGRLRPRLRLPGFRAGLHPAAVLRGQGAVPLGGAVGRPCRHRRDRPRGTRAVPRRRAAGTVDHRAPRTRSRSRDCRRGSAGWATASGTGPGCGSTTWWPAAS